MFLQKQLEDEVSKQTGEALEFANSCFEGDELGEHTMLAGLCSGDLQ